jgi:hypothetical protein
MAAVAVSFEQLPLAGGIEGGLFWGRGSVDTILAL